MKRVYRAPRHATSLEVMRAEMRDAHYRPHASFDFLPLQNLELFELAPE